MWEISNSLQAINFLYSIVLGIILALVYDFIRALRKIKAYSAIAVFFQDVIYFILAVPIVFCFLLATTNGELRGFVFFGIMLGFIISLLSVSRLNLKFLVKVFMFLKKNNERMRVLSSKIYLFFYKKIREIKKKTKKILKMSRNTDKNS